ncbi:MAG: alpha/beta fold hydrolase [Clostridia bacterium]|nr:alpha/beta fold hydrolase [Clostridia bacterium]
MVWVIVILLLLALLLFIGCYFIFRALIWRKSGKAPPKIVTFFIKGSADSEEFVRDQAIAEDKIKTLAAERVERKTRDGETLVAYIAEPRNANDKIIIGCHGMNCNGRREFCFFGSDFYDKGYTLILPDHRGSGESDGDFMGYGTHESKDTFTWVKYAKERWPEKHIFLIGVSMGAATVLMMSSRHGIRDVDGIIADCAYTTAWDEFSYQLKTSFHLPDFPIMQICNMYCKFICGYEFRDAAPLKAVRKAEVPILFIHGTADALVPPYMQEQLYEECGSGLPEDQRKEKFGVKVEGAIHARSYYTNPDLYSKAVETFITHVLRPRTLNISYAAPAENDESAGEEQ